MAAETQGVSFLIIKGFIDAKNERGKEFYGSFVALASRRDVRFVSVMFLPEQFSKETDWRGLLNLHKKKTDGSARDQAYINVEDSLDDFLHNNPVLHGVVKNRNSKSAEQGISRFCMEALQLRAVSFVDHYDPSEADIAYIMNLQDKGSSDAGESKPDDAPAPDDVPAEGDAPDKKEHENEIFIRCEPVLDPVVGVAMNELEVGMMVYTRMPSDSVFYRLLARNDPSFSGIVEAEVTGIRMNELGTANISMKIIDNISGIMKLSGKVRVRVRQGSEGSGHGGRKRSSRPFRLAALSPEAIVAFSSILLLAAALIAVVYIFTD